MDDYYEDEYSDWDLDTVDLHFVSGITIHGIVIIFQRYLIRVGRNIEK